MGVSCLDVFSHFVVDLVFFIAVANFENRFMLNDEITVLEGFMGLPFFPVSDLKNSATG